MSDENRNKNKADLMSDENRDKNKANLMKLMPDENTEK